MLVIICLLSIIIAGLIGLCIYFYCNRKKENLETIKQNKIQLDRYNEYQELISQQQEHLDKLNNKITETGTELKILNVQKQNANEDIIKTQEISRSAFSKYQDQLQMSYESAEEEYDRLISQLQAAYDKKQDFLIEQVKNQKAATEEEINQIKNELSKIKETRAAALEAQRREELLKQEKDLFRVILNQNELTTIEMINEIKPRLPEPRILCMLIWSTFYQKKLDALCKKILGNKTVCGVYKITNISNGLCYIGQAKDMDKRWKEHVKCGLGIDTPVGNKLYQAMKETGPENFTFELLEACSAEQLNEKEKFYIDLYQSKDFGYNSNKGIG